MGRVIAGRRVDRGRWWVWRPDGGVFGRDRSAGLPVAGASWRRGGLPRSGGGREGADPVERADEVVLPGPAGREVQRPAPGAGRQPAGKGQEPAAQGARGADGAGG